jgi:hypothetical protein
VADAAALAVEIPEGWSRIEIAPPAAQSARVRLTSLQAWGQQGGAALAIACHETQIDGYTPEADGFVRDRLVGVAAGLAEKLGTEAPRPSSPPRRAQTVAIDLESPASTGRAVYGFSRHDDAITLVSCVGVCAKKHACAEPLARARLTGALVDPPPPTLSMRALGLVLHHPRGAAAACVGLAIVLGIVAVATRRRPHRRPKTT